MKIEIVRCNRKTEEWFLSGGGLGTTNDSTYSGELEVKAYVNKVSGQSDPMIKRADGRSFIHLSTIKSKGMEARIVDSAGQFLKPTDIITED
jgi:hypothetical protein